MAREPHTSPPARTPWSPREMDQVRRAPDRPRRTDRRLRRRDPAAAHPRFPPARRLTSGGPVLKSVWHVPSTTVNVLNAGVAGNVVVSAASRARGDTVFIDGTTGRITGRATRRPGQDDGGGSGRGAIRDDASAATDARGRPLVALGDTPNDDTANDAWLVYDTSGHLVWPAPADGLGAALETGLWAVRPGLLAAVGYGPSGSQVALVDVSRPGRARVSPLRPPTTRHMAARSAPLRAAVAAGHLYVSWSVPHEKHQVLTRYDPPGTRPVWHVTVPSGASAVSGIKAYPVGAGAVASTDVKTAARDDRFWLRRSDTGAPIGPRHGRKGELLAVVGGHAYVNYGQAHGTQVIDLHTGSTRTAGADRCSRPSPTGRPHSASCSESLHRRPN